VKRLAVVPGDRVLEVGVGTGLSVPVYPGGAHVTGIDISEPMLERARARVEALGRDDVLLQKMDARSMAYPDGHFDKLLAPYVISVVADPEVVLREMVRVCRPGGTIIVVNKFQSDFKPLAWLEWLLSPLTSWIGFRMDTPVAIVTRTPGMTLVRKEKVNLFGLWTLLEFRRS
jgi:phosphatidylethanolamine/phosphatidyl-N-methylethanolamine N-methyltransferase